MSDSKLKRPLFVVAVVILSQIVFLLSLVSPQSIKVSISKELTYMESIFGRDSTKRIYAQSKQKTHDILYESGAIDFMRKAFLPKKYLLTGHVDDDFHRNLNTNFWQVIDGMIKNIGLNVEFTLLRYYALTKWIALVLIMISAAVLTGWFQRQIKRFGFDYSSPLRHGLARKGIYLAPTALYLLFVIPFAIPPMLFPVFFAIFAMSISFFIANTIKRV